MSVKPLPEKRPPRTDGPRRESHGKYSLLIVDDESPVLENLSALLDDEFDIFTATRTIDATGILHAEPIDIILSDYRMPGENGISFLTEASRLFPGTVRVLMTAYGETGLVIQAVNEAGVYRFLSKPYRGSYVLSLMRQCAAHAGAKAAARAGGRTRPLIAVAHRSAEVRKLVSAVLEEQFLVVTVASGFEFMEVLGRKEAAGAVIDVALDDIDSATIATYLRRRKRTFPLIVLGAVDPSLDRFMRECGADLFADEKDPDSYTILLRHFDAVFHGRPDASHRHHD